jgi:hypothetical protein
VAGWFVALTLRHPDTGFLSRALASLAGAVGVVVAVLSLRGDSWSVLDWQMTERVRAYFRDRARGAARAAGSRDALAGAGDGAVRGGGDPDQGVSATMALATLAALAVAWWLYVRMAHGDDQGLLPLREFRFNDQLVWLFIGGLARTRWGARRSSGRGRTRSSS